MPTSYSLQRHVKTVLCLLGQVIVGNSFSTTGSSSVLRYTARKLSIDRTCQVQRNAEVPLFMVPVQLNGDEGGDKGGREPLTVENVASMIEVSFVEGVMQLAQGYVETAKLFVAAVLTGYGMTLPLDELIEQVKACPNQSANRPLMKEEEDLRSIWIKLVYLTANHVQYRKAVVQDTPLLKSLFDNDNDDDNDSVDWKVYQSMLPRLLEKHSEGNETGPRFQAQEILTQNAHFLPATQDAMQKALLLQNLRLIWITLTVMEEEKLCISSDQDPPAPPIPNQL